MTSVTIVSIDSNRLLDDLWPNWLSVVTVFYDNASFKKEFKDSN